MPIRILIFSRDRAMQLDATLRSLFLHCQDCEKARIFVYYRATSSLHARQYESLKEAYPGVVFLEQDDFRDDVLRIISPYPAGSFAAQCFSLLNWLISRLISLEGIPFRVLQSIFMRLRVHILGNLLPGHIEDSYVLFLVDDNLFVKAFSLLDITQQLIDHPEALGFSLRLGTNITYCYTLDRPQSIPDVDGIYPGILKFDWTKAEADFGYPLEISSSVYRSQDIFPVIAKQSFKNPNELEYQLAVSADEFSGQKPFLLCPDRSITFCNPLNTVQTFVPNRGGEKINYTSEYLADLFDQGYRIEVGAYAGFVPYGCHQEVDLKFYKSQ